MRWWLSFADPGRPPGQQFLGVAVVEAPDFITACRAAKTYGCNPGGEVKGWEVPDPLPADCPPFPMNRLLSYKEMVELGMEPASEAELEKEGLEMIDGGCVLCPACQPERPS